MNHIFPQVASPAEVTHVTSDNTLPDFSQQLSPNTQKYLRYFDVICTCCEEIYELDYQQACISVVYTKQPVPFTTGALSAAMPYLTQTDIHPDDVSALPSFYDPEYILALLANHDKPYLQKGFRRRNHYGDYRWYLLLLLPIAPDDITSDHQTFLYIIRDIHDRRKTEVSWQLDSLQEQQYLQNQRYQTIMRQTDTLDFEWRTSTGKQYLSPKISRRFAGVYDDRMLLNVWIEDHIVHPQDAAILQNFIDELQSLLVCPLPIVIRLRQRNDTYIWCRIAISFLKEKKIGMRLIGTINNVDSETKATLSLKYRAEYDPITNIHNQESFYEQASLLLQRNWELSYLLVRIDIDRFKLINEMFSMAEGNRLLHYLAQIISNKQGKNAICGRLHADIFCVCLPLVGQAAVNFIDSINRALADYPLPYKISIHAGMCLIEDHNTPVHLLCDWAGMALATVKGNYFRSYAFYNIALRKRMLAEKDIENEMDDALNDGEFRLYLQPKVDIATGQIMSAEALSRWIHPEKGIIPPADFIPLFERNGFINKLDECIWRQTCAVLRTWLDRGYNVLPISINISRTHFHDSSLCDKLVDLVEEYRIPPRLLELELTESAYLDNEQRIVEIIAELQSYGFRFSMDDFGTGYSSLSTLKNLPLDVVKIDRSFLNDSLGSQKGRTIIEHTIRMARAMNMEVVAEGVETVEDAAYLLRAQCHLAQGYYYSPPITLDDFEMMAFGPTAQFPVSPIIKDIVDQMRQE